MWRFWLGLIIAFGCGDPKISIIDGGLEDALVDAFPMFGPCNILMQTGCAPGNRCTVLHVPVPGGFERRVGCAPDGTVSIGTACLFTTATNEPAYDNCVSGSVCAGICKAVCNSELGDAACPSTHACQVYSGMFPGQTTPPAGVCDHRCDPLDDNDFDGSGTTLSRPGTSCEHPAVGCYGYPSFGDAKPTLWACTIDVYGELDGGRQNEAGRPFINGCDQGYMMLNGTCHALCKPGATYQGNPNPQYPLGQAPHRCNDTDARGTFFSSDRCVYLWRLEIGANGTFTRSSTSDTVGVCLSGSWPSCDSLPLTAASGSTAADYGCVDTAMASSLPTTRLQGY